MFLIVGICYNLYFLDLKFLQHDGKIKYITVQLKTRTSLTNINKDPFFADKV